MNSQKDKLRIAAQPGLKIEVEYGGLQDKAPSMVVGGLFPKYIIIKEPSVHPTNKHLWNEYQYPDNEITVRYICEGIASGYKSKLCRTIKSPDKLIFIRYPKLIETYNLRRHQRVYCFIEADILIEKQQASSVLEDISTSGCCVSYLKEDLPKKPEIGDLLNLSCPYFSNLSNLPIPCRIQRMTNHKSKVELGLTFEKPDPEILIKIQDYVATILHHTAF